MDSRTPLQKFRRAIDVTVASAIWQCAIVYIDDVNILSEAPVEILEHLGKVLELLISSGMTLKLIKCHFYSKSIDSMGHVTAPGKLKVARTTVEAVELLKHPENIFQMRFFIGLCSFHGCLAPRLTMISPPLKERLRKEDPTKFILEDQEFLAVDELKTSPMRLLAMALQQANGEHIVHTDASNAQI